MSVRPLSEDFMAGVKAGQTKETAQAKQAGAYTRPIFGST